MSVATSRYDIQANPPTNRPLRRSPRRSSRNKKNNNGDNNSNKSNNSDTNVPLENNSGMMSPPSRKRRSGRGSSSLWELARSIKDGKQVVFVTGAGLSVASGVRAFRTTNQSNSKYSTDSSWKNNPASTSGTSGTKAIAKKKRKGKSGESKKGLVEEQPLGIWNSVLWSQAKRETFRKDPLLWWNDFWLRYFPVEDYEHRYDPNAGHFTLAALQRRFPETIKIITQNVDGLQHSAIDSEEGDPETATKLKENIIEAHGRLGLYKCVPSEDSDTDSSDDEDDDRPVHLGHRRKYRAWKRRHHQEADPPPISITRKKKTSEGSGTTTLVSTDVSSDSDGPICQYQMLKSLRVDQLGPSAVVRSVLKPSTRRKANNKTTTTTTTEQHKPQRLLKTPPCCPSCGNTVLPQALLFDEGYHSHEHYNFTKMEDWLAAAEVLVFVGTSFAVTLPLVALDHAREVGIPVFNFNVSDMLEPTARLNAENIAGPSQETLPKLMQAVEYFEKEDAFIYGRG